VRPFSQFISQMQVELFPALEETFGGLTQDDERVVAALEVTQIERFVPPPPSGSAGRPETSRRPIARAFVAKAVLGLTSTLVPGFRKLGSSVTLCLWRGERGSSSKVGCTTSTTEWGVVSGSSMIRRKRSASLT